MDIDREIARPFEEWREELGDVVWWYFRDGKVQEAPYIGHPNDLGHTIEVEVRIGDYAAEVAVHRHQVGGWPGYHTHWTPLPPVPRLPVQP